jgi:hypothetical protein
LDNHATFSTTDRKRRQVSRGGQRRRCLAGSAWRLQASQDVFGGDPDFRGMLKSSAKEIAPAILLETEKV